VIPLAAPRARFKKLIRFSPRRLTSLGRVALSIAKDANAQKMDSFGRVLNFYGYSLDGLS
jgi:hypothetical protein